MRNGLDGNLVNLSDYSGSSVIGNVQNHSCAGYYSIYKSALYCTSLIAEPGVFCCERPIINGGPADSVITHSQ